MIPTFFNALVNFLSLVHTKNRATNLVLSTTKYIGFLQVFFLKPVNTKTWGHVKVITEFLNSTMLKSKQANLHIFKHNKTRGLGWI